ADTKLGILVGRYSGDIDPSSGDFSGSVKGGYLIENGRKTQPLLGTMIAGNIYDCIQNISAISSDTVSLIDVFIPSIRLEGVTVSSK
ncbi:MAG: metallopeptidase TldD-related protein, partial [Caldisericia bacterium]